MAIGKRLREERKKLNMTQAAFAQVGGIGVSSLKMYEGDEREPGAVFLSAVAAAGADVGYILTGFSRNSLESMERYPVLRRVARDQLPEMKDVLDRYFSDQDRPTKDTKPLSQDEALLNLFHSLCEEDKKTLFEVAHALNWGSERHKLLNM